MIGDLDFLSLTYQALQSAGLLQPLRSQSPGVSLLAPTNQGFARAARQLGLDSIQQLLANRPVVRRILEQHLLPFVVSSHLALWPVLFFWGGCFAGLYSVALTVIGQRFRGNELVVANVAIGVVWGVGSLTGPSITGIAMDIWDPQGFPGVFFMGSTLFVLIGAIRWILTSDKTKAL